MSKVQTILENFGNFLNELTIEKYSIVIKRETKTSNPIVFVRLNKKLSFTKQNEATKRFIDSLDIELIESYKNGLARYFSNEITKADDLKNRLELEKSVNEVSFL